MPSIFFLFSGQLDPINGLFFIFLNQIKTNDEISLLRYPSDIHDRLWYPFDRDDWTQINTSLTSTTEANGYQVPSIVMCTAATPKNANDSLNIFWLPSASNAQYQIYMYFAEVEKLKTNESRQLNVTVNGQYYFGPFTLDYLSATTIYTASAWRPIGQYVQFSILKNENSTLPPILNAYEIYMVKPVQESETNLEDG